MPEFRFGPVEFYLVGFEGDRPNPAVKQALLDLLATGMVRLLDIAVIKKDADGTVHIVEIEEASEASDFGDLDIVESGLASDEDIEDFAQLVPDGGSAALVAVELVFQRALASKLAAAGSVVLATERIPAPVVNAVLDIVEPALEGEGA